MLVDHAIKDREGASYLFRRRHPADELSRKPGIVALLKCVDYELRVVHIEATDDLRLLGDHFADHRSSDKLGVATLLTPHMSREDRDRLAAELGSVNVEQITASRQVRAEQQESIE